MSHNFISSHKRDFSEIHKPKVSIKTFGCRLNQAETADIAASFVNNNYEVVPFGEPADICIIHSCAVTAKAESEALRLVRKIKEDLPCCKVIIAGCVSEVVPISRLYQFGADIVVGQKDKYKIPSLISASQNSTPSKIIPFFETTRALLKIQDGCNFFCTYCIVPYARGASYSLPFHEIIEKAHQLADLGFKEIVITGANIGTYNYNRKNLIHLLEAVESINGIERIRLSSLEISTVEYPLFYFMASSKKLCRYLHIPMQSGDDEILKAMNRRYSSIDYRAAIEKFLECVPNAGLGTDIIIGFPGETEEAFTATLKLVGVVPFSNLHVFPFSPRQLTRAAKLNNPVPSRIVKDRTQKLLELGKQKYKNFAEKFIGKTLKILIEKTTSENCEGWSEEYIYVISKKGNIPVNSIVEVIPVKYENESLRADFKEFA